MIQAPFVFQNFSGVPYFIEYSAHFIKNDKEILLWKEVEKGLEIKWIMWC